MKVTLRSGQTIVRPRMKVYYKKVGGEPGNLALVAGIFKCMRAVRGKQKADMTTGIYAASAEAHAARKAVIAYMPAVAAAAVDLYTPLNDRDKLAQNARKAATDRYSAELWKLQHPLFLLHDIAVKDGYTLRKATSADDQNDYEVWKDGVKIGEFSASKFDHASAGVARALYQRDGSDARWVNDNLGNKTRRVAYMEKNIHQLRDFLITGRMEGRYQQLHKACDLVADKFDHLDGFVSSLLPKGATAEAVAKDRKIRLAIVHQFLGSGPHQRGLSMTQTTKRDVTFGNAGESFRSDDGVRIEVDLSLVPPDVLILNHCHAADIVDPNGYMVEKGPEKRVVNITMGKRVLSYNYVASVTKNREIYLEYLLPEWITGIEIHHAAGDIAIRLENKNIEFIRAAVEVHVSQTRFETGVNDALRDWTVDALVVTMPPAGMSAAGEKAYAAGVIATKNFIAGWTEAQKKLDVEVTPITPDGMLAYLQSVNDTAKGRDPTFVPQRVNNPVEVPATYDKRGMTLTKKTRRDVFTHTTVRTDGTPPKYDMHWVGYARRCMSADKADITYAAMWPTGPEAVSSENEVIEDAPVEPVNIQVLTAALDNSQ